MKQKKPRKPAPKKGEKMISIMNVSLIHPDYADKFTTTGGIIITMPDGTTYEPDKEKKPTR